MQRRVRAGQVGERVVQGVRERQLGVRAREAADQPGVGDHGLGHQPAPREEPFVALAPGAGRQRVRGVRSQQFGEVVDQRERRARGGARHGARAGRAVPAGARAGEPHLVDLRPGVDDAGGQQAVRGGREQAGIEGARRGDGAALEHVDVRAALVVAHHGRRGGGAGGRAGRQGGEGQPGREGGALAGVEDAAAAHAQHGPRALPGGGRGQRVDGPRGAGPLVRCPRRPHARGGERRVEPVAHHGVADAPVHQQHDGRARGQVPRQRLDRVVAAEPGGGRDAQAAQAGPRLATAARAIISYARLAASSCVTAPTS